MKAVFIELPAFERHRRDYLDDDAFGRLHEALMGDPEAGDLIEGAREGRAQVEEKRREEKAGPA